MPLPTFNLHQIVPTVERDRESSGVRNRTFPYQGVLMPGDKDDGLIVVVHAADCSGGECQIERRFK